MQVPSLDFFLDEEIDVLCDAVRVSRFSTGYVVPDGAQLIDFEVDKNE